MPIKPSSYACLFVPHLLNCLTFSLKVISVVVLLNVLVACMNYTMQRMKDQQLLYWKFVRTSIWIEFFGENSALPQPFSLITVLRAIVKGIYRRLYKRCSKTRKTQSQFSVRAQYFSYQLNKGMLSA